MREILFRAKTASTDNPEWVEGYYAFDETHWIESKSIEYPERVWEANPINPETLGEFTGIKDRNGVKVFEGDILRADNGHIGYVIFRNGSFVKVCFCHKLNIYTFYGDNETVIGNIYDNPELLEEVK